MAEKLVIEVYKTKNNEELTKLIAEPHSRLETGSGAAVTAAVAAAFLEKAAALSVESLPKSEELDYILRNSEIIRSYMIHLIDEDVKSRGPLRRAEKEGGAREIEAGRQTAVSICGEIVNMMGKCLELLSSLKELCPKDARHYIVSSAETAMGSVKSAMSYILDMASKSPDETYRFVVRRENELSLEQFKAIYDQILAACGE